MIKALSSLFWSFAATAMLLVAWLLIPTSLVFEPISIVYNPATGTAVFQRIVHWPDPITARRNNSVRAIVSGDQCYDHGERLYSPEVTEDIIAVPANLRRCLDQGRYFTILNYSVLVYGVLPMRPTTLIVSTEEAKETN